MLPYLISFLDNDVIYNYLSTSFIIVYTIYATMILNELYTTEKQQTEGGKREGGHTGNEDYKLKFALKPAIYDYIQSI